MRALILSDIHANIDALDAVLAAAPQHDVVWNLGDVVGYNAAPQAVIERVREMGTLFVRGNHDRACAGLIGGEHFNSIAFRAVQWTRRQLDPESTRWLKEMPPGPILPDGDRVSCVHGSLLDEDEYLLSTEDAERQRPTRARRLLSSATRMCRVDLPRMQRRRMVSAEAGLQRGRRGGKL